jgi:ornithine cyclodeaminase
MTGPRIVGREEIRQALTFDRLIPALAEGFRQYRRGQAIVAPITNIDLPHVNGEMHIKPGYLRDGDWLCVKIATCYYDNPARGLPTRDGVLILSNLRNGRIEAVLCDAGLLTDMRTAGASAVAVDALARPGTISLGLVGVGTQAFWHAAALRAVRTLGDVRVWGRHPDRARAVVERMRRELGLPAAVAALEEAAEADVVVTATPARAPVLDRQRLRPGSVIVAMGADAAGKRELGAAIMEQVALVVPDSLGQCERLGELQWVPAPRSMRVAELGAVLDGETAGRQHPDEIIVFDSTGVAFQDVVGAAEVLRVAGGTA